MGTREEPLRQRFCRWPDSGLMFWICRHCDRGHPYCGERCAPYPGVSGTLTHLIWALPSTQTGLLPDSESSLSGNYGFSGCRPGLPRLGAAADPSVEMIPPQ